MIIGQILFHSDMAEHLKGQCHIANMPRGIQTVDELFRELKTQFSFPYFGKNWDALLDCLSSLDEWLRADRFVIVHKDIPLNQNISDIHASAGTYIDVLLSCCDRWNESDRPIIDEASLECRRLSQDKKDGEFKIDGRFLVFFPDSSRQYIEEVTAKHV